MCADVTVIATAGSAEKLSVARELGADVCINHKEADFADLVSEAIGGRGVDVILDFVGASYFEKNYRSIAVDGRWVLIGMLGGAHVEGVNLFELMLKRVKLIGTLLTQRSDAYKEKLSAEFAERMLPKFVGDLARLRPIVDTAFPLEDIRAAHDRMENSGNVGKIIIEM